MVKIPCFQCSGVGGGVLLSSIPGQGTKTHMLCFFENVNKADKCLLRQKEKAQINSIIFKKKRHIV